MPFTKGDPNINRTGRPENPYNKAIKKHISPEMLAKAIAHGIEKGDSVCIKYAGDRILGTPRQTIDQTVYQTENPVLDSIKALRQEMRGDGGSTAESTST